MTSHPTNPSKPAKPVAKVLCHLVKKAAVKGAIQALAPGASASGMDFQFVDNGDATCTVHGVAASGASIDISGVATIGVTSSAPTVVTVDSPVGMTFAMHVATPPPAPGTTAKITVVATWNDGSAGPFTFDLNVTIVPGGPTGITISIDSVTTH